MKTSLCAASVLLTLAAAGAASAVPIGLHYQGDGWGAWIHADFDLFNVAPGVNEYTVTDNGSGMAMDFMMDLPDGTRVDGSQATMRMYSLTISGDVGDDEVQLVDWGIWVDFDVTDDLTIGLHVESTSAVALDNLGSSGKDGVSYANSINYGEIEWTYLNADGTSQTFTNHLNTIEFTAPGIPAPGAAALFGLAGLTAARRRRI